MVWPSISVRNPGYAFSRASWARQSKLVRQVSTMVLQVGDGGALRPAVGGQLVGVAGARQSVHQVVEIGLGDVDPERRDRGGLGCLR